VTFRTRTFVSVFLAASIALGVSTLLVEHSLRVWLTSDIEQGLLTQARVAAALLAERPDLADPEQEASRSAP